MTPFKLLASHRSIFSNGTGQVANLSRNSRGGQRSKTYSQRSPTFTRGPSHNQFTQAVLERLRAATRG